MAATFGGTNGIGGYTADANGLVTYADGSTYQRPSYGKTGTTPPTGAQMAGMMGSSYSGEPSGPVSFTDGATWPVQQYGGGLTPSQTPQGGAAWGGSNPATMTGTFGKGDNSYPGGMTQGNNGLTPAPGGGTPASGGNPYLSSMGDVMAGQMTNNFRTNIAPQIASGAMAAGGFGGSRQGVMEANAMNDLNGQIGGALTNLYGQQYNMDRNYDLGMTNARNSYDLGLRGNDLGFAGLDANINQNNFNNNMAGANFGLGVWNQGMQNNQTGINAGTNIQNTPQNYWNSFADRFNSIGQGYGSTTGTATQPGNPVMGALGGAQIGSRIGNMWGGGAGSASDTAAGNNFWAPNFRGGMGD